jgi:N-acetyltransferase 10
MTLQLLSDAPAHHLFVHLPVKESLVVLQVTLLGKGMRADGDMITWLATQQFQEGRFGKLSGTRVVRIACLSDCVQCELA